MAGVLPLLKQRLTTPRKPSFLSLRFLHMSTCHSLNSTLHYHCPSNVGIFLGYFVLDCRPNRCRLVRMDLQTQRQSSLPEALRSTIRTENCNFSRLSMVILASIVTRWTLLNRFPQQLAESPERAEIPPQHFASGNTSRRMLL